MAEMGDSLDAILEECEAGGVLLPDEIVAHFEQREPWMDIYFQAFEDLSTCRGHSGKVPWLAIDRYCERLGIDGDFALWFTRCIRKIDDAFTAVWKEQKDREEEDLKRKSRQ